MADDTRGASASSVPERPTLDGIEATWTERWDKEGTYLFDRSQPRTSVFSIDTPPPTVSGSLHIGHVFSYTQTDAIARYRRMRGSEVFYPMGWDDNGLATERRVERFFGVRCDPSVPFDDAFVAPVEAATPPVGISRRNFIDLCNQLTARDEEAFKDLWRRLGLSVDWSYEYATISEVARRASQRGFLRMLARGEVYSTVAPTLWDVDFKTAVSQAELVDRDHPGAYHRVAFGRADGAGAVEIETTRPELLPSCVALVANPDDERYAPLFGTEVVTPLFGVHVPVVAHELAERDKGTGIAMVCTFGDTTDVVWWRELGLATRPLVGRDGRMLPAPFGDAGYESDDPAAARSAYAQIEGRTVKQAQVSIVAQLAASGALIGEPRPITHPVKFYEKGDRPLEIVSSRQWFVGTLVHREAVMARGEEVSGTRTTWPTGSGRGSRGSTATGASAGSATSASRSLLVPGARRRHGRPRRGPRARRVRAADRPVVRGARGLRRGPAWPARRVRRRSRRDGHVGDQLAHAAHRGPMGGRPGPLRPRVPDGHARPGPRHHPDLAVLVDRAKRLEHHVLPWRSATISGWVVDPDRKKMGKSSGNAVTPLALLEEFGSDALRYWATSGRLGTDTVEDAAQMRVGRRLAIKVLNASKFVLSRLDGVAPGGSLDAVTEPIDRDLLWRWATSCASRRPRSSRWTTRGPSSAPRVLLALLHDYLELVKTRAYGEPGDSATRRLGWRSASRSRCCCGCSRRSSASRPRRSGAGGTRARSTARHGHRPTS